MPRATDKPTTARNAPRPTAVIIPFARAKAARSPNQWAHPAAIETEIARVQAIAPHELLHAAYVSMNLSHLTDPDADVRLGCAMRALLCLARALDEAGFPVVLTEARA